jgi:hypothetical protein
MTDSLIHRKIEALDMSGTRHLLVCGDDIDDDDDDSTVVATTNAKRKAAVY